jgi:hypothetical protein
VVELYLRLFCFIAPTTGNTRFKPINSVLNIAELIPHLRPQSFNLVPKSPKLLKNQVLYVIGHGRPLELDALFISLVAPILGYPSFSMDMEKSYCRLQQKTRPDPLTNAENYCATIYFFVAHDEKNTDARDLYSRDAGKTRKS